MNFCEIVAAIKYCQDNTEHIFNHVFSRVQGYLFNMHSFKDTKSQEEKRFQTNYEIWSPV